MEKDLAGVWDRKCSGANWKSFLFVNDTILMVWYCIRDTNLIILHLKGGG